MFDDNDAIADFPDDNNNSALFKFKQIITCKNRWWWQKNVEIMVSLKYLSNFWKILEMSLINCEINLIVTCNLGTVEIKDYVMTDGKKCFINQ